MNHAPDATLAVLFEHAPYLVALGEVAGESVDLCAILVRLGGVLGQSFTSNLRDAVEGLRMRVVKIVYGNDLEATSALEDVDDMRA